MSDYQSALDEEEQERNQRLAEGELITLDCGDCGRTDAHLVREIKNVRVMREHWKALALKTEKERDKEREWLAASQKALGAEQTRCMQAEKERDRAFEDGWAVGRLSVDPEAHCIAADAYDARRIWAYLKGTGK